MVRAPQVVRDHSGSIACKSGNLSAAIEKRKFMSASIGSMYVGLSSGGPRDAMDDTKEKESFRKLFKAVECLGTSQMSWKERKKIENKTVVSLGGKPKKNQRVPITLGRNIARKQQKKHQKLVEEGFLDRFVLGKDTSTKNEKEKPGKTTLKVSQGHFRNGMLDVREILKQDSTDSRKEDQSHGSHRGKRSGKRKQQKSKKKRRRS